MSSSTPPLGVQGYTAEEEESLCESEMMTTETVSSWHGTATQELTETGQHHRVCWGTRRLGTSAEREGDRLLPLTQKLSALDTHLQRKI